jgi:hypothetical protein
MMKKALKYFQRASGAKARFHLTGGEVFFHHSTLNGTGGLTALAAL